MREAWEFDLESVESECEPSRRSGSRFRRRDRVGRRRMISAAAGLLMGNVLDARAGGVPVGAVSEAPPPAPLGVFGADMPAEGRLALTIAPNFSHQSGFKIGARTVSNQFIIATVPFFLNPNLARQQLRNFPENIATASQAVSLAYGVTRDFAMVLATGMVEKNLELLTYKGSTGFTPLGSSYPGTAGLVDSTLSGVYRVYRDEVNSVQVSLGLSFPTGPDTATLQDFLLPSGLRSSVRAFYGMEPGAGTYDILPGVAYRGYLGPWSWGAAYRGRLPLGPNLEGYQWGDLHEFTGWGGYSWTSDLTTTVRVSGSTQGPIRGADPEINGPAVPANPNFYGGQRVEIFGGAALNGEAIGYENATLAIEAGLPIYQNLNGPQIMKNWQAGMSLRFRI